MNTTDKNYINPNVGDWVENLHTTTGEKICAKEYYYFGQVVGRKPNENEVVVFYDYITGKYEHRHVSKLQFRSPFVKGEEQE